MKRERLSDSCGQCRGRALSPHCRTRDDRRPADSGAGRDRRGINWFCAPRFDSPSIFGSLLDARNGGHWRISPVGEVAKRQQYYFPDTNILMTRMLTENGIVEIQDFMPIRAEGDRNHRQRLVRRVVSVRGSARIRAVICLDGFMG